VIVGGVAAVAVGALLGSWVWSSVTDSREVLAARTTIHRGEVITAEDLQRVRVDGDLSASALPASMFDTVVGTRATIDVGGGAPLTRDAAADEPLPPSGRSLVGISLTAAQAPSVPLHGGDRVRIFLTPTENGEVPAGAPQFTTAEVVDTSLDEASGNMVVNVLVPFADAGALAVRAATGNVALVVDPATGGGR